MGVRRGDEGQGGGQQQRHLHRHRVLLAERGVPLGHELALLIDPLRPRQGAPERLGHLVGHQVLPPLEHRRIFDEFLQPLLQLGQGDIEPGDVLLQLCNLLDVRRLLVQRCIATA